MPDRLNDLETDIEEWARHMRAIRQPVPDFWSEMCASERLADWLSMKGYTKAVNHTASPSASDKSWPR